MVKRENGNGDRGSFMFARGCVRFKVELKPVEPNWPQKVGLWNDGFRGVPRKKVVAPEGRFLMSCIDLGHRHE